MILTHHHLQYIVSSGILANADPANINPASIDVRLGSKILVEGVAKPGEAHIMGSTPLCDLMKKESLNWFEEDLNEPDRENNFYDLWPGQFILAQTIEIFNLPNYIAAEFRLKSTGARNGLDQSLAVWCDPGWHGSVLTIELRNNCQYHTLRLRAGMKIGQVIFYHCFPVPDEHSYAVTGQYNNDKEVTAGKNLK